MKYSVRLFEYFRLLKICAKPSLSLSKGEEEEEKKKDEKATEKEVNEPL